MSDLAAVSLGEWFLTDPGGRSAETLVEILQSDPPLALWVALKADCLACAPRSLVDLAAPLAEHGLEWLQWDAEHAAEGLPRGAGVSPALACGAGVPPAPAAGTAAPQERGVLPGQVLTGEELAALPDAKLCEAIAAGVALAVLTAELAAEIAASHGDEVGRQAQLLGLLRDPGQWLKTAGQPIRGADEFCDPQPLSGGNFDPLAQLAVEQARRKLFVSPDSDDDPPGPAVVSAEYSSRALVAAARWAAGHRAARLLSPLMARLARLAAMERSFAETVEGEKIAAMAEFAAGAGHELNNPLAVIAGRAQLLLRDETDPERRRDLALMNTQAMRVNEMIADLRLFATPPELQCLPVDLNVLLGNLVTELQAVAAEQETKLCFVAGAEPIAVAADAVQLTVAVRALCQNALEALGHGGQVEVVIARQGEEAMITVSDDGPGILPVQRPRIFEPFYSARQAGRGVGMGLSKCWRIVNMHGGRIDVGGGSAGGAAFTIHVPLGSEKMFPSITVRDPAPDRSR